uniref:Isolate Cr1 peroxinectin mRNA n=1 Tax=Caligus rogercresseyi TaxID=217165 RepID=A0A0A7LU88_CALRO|nr:peroxinectin [Caligus rogercresseyi]
MMFKMHLTLCSILVFGLLIQGIFSQVFFPGAPDNLSGRRGGCRVGICQPVVDCAGRLSIEERIRNTCLLDNSEQGLCCLPLAFGDVNSFEVRQTPKPEDICPADIQFNPLLRSATFSSSVQFPISSITNANPIARGTSSFFHDGHQAPKQEALILSRIALNGLQTARESVLVPFGNGVCRIESENRNFDQNCPRAPRCDYKNKYRRVDGFCNNPHNPLYGGIFTPVQRILRPAYHDGFSSPRRGSKGEPLPSARKVSLQLTQNTERPSSRFTSYLMSMGQFLDHDMVHVPVYRQKNGEGIDCCSSQFGRNSLQCFPIKIPFGDRTFKNRDCINFVRSLPGPDIDCKPGPNQQINQLTHWLDGSNIYGSAKEEEHELRLFRKGKLKMEVNGLLPNNEENEECVNSHECFLAGDSRVNEQMGLAVVHTLWVRLHNKIAHALCDLNPHWKDEKAFQETKRIVVAIWQHVVYNEWLPVLLGPKIMDTFGLWTLRKGFSHDYRTDFDPRITNAFAAAAFRVGHTMIPSFLKTFNLVNSRLSKQFQLRSIFNNPSALKQRGVFDEMAYGLTLQNVEKYDNSFTSEITDHLFEHNGPGLDLIALNIQRGRDHGIPGYIKYREICGLGKVNSFNDLLSNIPYDRVQRLKSVYSNVADIDLFIGMSLEVSYRDGYVGRTFMCLIADQFARLKKGDRFFYDLYGQAGSFTEPQLHAIRKMSLARIMCETTRIKKVQPFSLEQPDSRFNKGIPCSSNSIPHLDLNPWRS